MAKRGKRMTRAEKVEQSKAAGNPPVAEEVESPAVEAAVLVAALQEGEQIAAEREDALELISKLRSEIADLNRQAKSRPFPTAPNGSGGRREASVIGSPIRVRGRIGLVVDDQRGILTVALADGFGGAAHRTFPIQQCHVVPLDSATTEALKLLPEHLLLSYGHCL